MNGGKYHPELNQYNWSQIMEVNVNQACVGGVCLKWLCSLNVYSCVCFLQEVSLHLWRCMTMSHGQHLIWPLGKATGCRLSTTRKRQRSSSCSSLRCHNSFTKIETSRSVDAHVIYESVNEQSELVTVGRCRQQSLILSICWLKLSRVTLH